MAPSLKRVLSSLLSLALVVGILPAACYEAVAANMKGEAPGARAGVPALALPAIGNLNQAKAGASLSANAQTSVNATAGQSAAANAAPTAAAAAAPQRVPMDVQVPAEATEQFTPAQKQDLGSVIALMSKRLFTWDQVTVRLPDSIFDNGSSKPLIKVEDLFKAPQADELERLAIKYGKLTPEQLAQIRKDATFSVPSSDFPGQTHVWKASALLQKGSENIKASLRSDYADAASQYVVSLPETIKGAQALSLRSGARNFFEGLYETVGLAIGIPETHARFSAGEVERRRLERLADFMSEKLSQRDLALYDLKLMEKTYPIVQTLEKLAAERWQAKAESVKEDLSSKIKDPQALADALAQAEQDELYQALSSSAELETLHAGLGALLVARGRAKQAIKSVLAAVAQKLQAYDLAVAQQLSAKHPILSMIPAWMAARVGKAHWAYAATLIPSTQEAVAAALAKLGLAEELAAEREFADTWEPISKSMPAYQTGNRNFSWAYQIWNRGNWIVEQDPQTGRYSGSQWRSVVRSTENAFWRLSNLAQRALATANNVLYWLVVSNVHYGPLGFSSLLGSEPFAYRWALNSETGQWVETSHRRQTLSTRISGFWAQRRSMLDAHNKKSSYSFFLGKLGERVILFFTADLALGVVAPLLVLVFQPLLTLVNAMVSLALLVATPLIIAPVYTVAVWALQALVFDSAGTMYKSWRSSLKKSFGLVGLAILAAAIWYAAKYFGIDLLSGYGLAAVVAMIAATGPLFPWVGTLIKKAGFYGAASFIASVFKSAFHIVAGPLEAVFGALRFAARTAYDAVMALPLRRLARVPGASGIFVKRIAGPGLSSEYFFQVSADLPLVAAWAALESSELARYDKETTALISEPQKTYDEFAAVLDVLTGGNNTGRANAPAFKEISEKQTADKKTLSDAVSQRAELYAKLLKVPHTDKIKLPTPELTMLLKKSAVLAEGFYTKIIKDQAWSEAKIKAFWKDAGLSANDWVGVAKKTLASVFGAEILIPLEETDKTLRIQVKAPGLEDYVKGLEDGILPGALDNVQVGGLGRPQGKPDVKPSVPSVSGDELIGSIL